MNKTRLRDRIARVALRQARRYGALATFQNASDDEATDVWCMLADFEQVTQLRKMGETDTFELTVIVPRQDDFPPTAFEPGAVFTYPKVDGVTYQIDNVDPDWEDPAQAPTFKLTLGKYGDTAELN